MGKGQYVVAMNKTTAKAAQKKAQSSRSAAQTSTSSPDRDNSGSEEDSSETETKRPSKKRRLAKALPGSDEGDNAERDVPNAEDLMTQMISNSS